MLAVTIDQPPRSIPAPEPIDFAHLFRMTLGDHSLEREVLQLFDRQTEMLVARMGGASPAVVAALAHTLKGSARGIGAWGVALAAEDVEIAAAHGNSPTTAVEMLVQAATTVRVTIAERLRAN
jgi:hypothetical protein